MQNKNFMQIIITWESIFRPSTSKKRFEIQALVWYILFLANFLIKGYKTSEAN